VFLAVWLTSFSGLEEMMLENDFPFYMVILLNVTHSVTILTFTFFPIFMSYNLIVKWLSAERPKIQDMNCIMYTLDQGLDLFEEEAKNAIPHEYTLRIEKMERRLEILKRMNFESTCKLKLLQTSFQQQIKDLYDDVVNGDSKYNKSPNVDIIVHESSTNSYNIDDKEWRNAHIENGLSDSDEGNFYLHSELQSQAKHPLIHPPQQEHMSGLLSSDPVRKSVEEMKKLMKENSIHEVKDMNNTFVAPSAESNQYNGTENEDVEAMEAARKNKVELPSTLTMSVLNRVKWECTEEFEEWKNEMTQEMAQYVEYFNCIIVLYIVFYVFESFFYIMNIYLN
jgi:hypothetical protein